VVFAELTLKGERVRDWSKVAMEEQVKGMGQKIANGLN
jgi:hypothetical protein